ncbi:MAG: hypothetical protein OEV36_08790 [Myxococcales bacterium]|nr:hypothetical protein [Myxococcales bacterium]
MPPTGDSNTDIKGWTLAERIDGEQFDLLRREAPAALAQYVRTEGNVEFPAPARLVVVEKRPAW